MGTLKNAPFFYCVDTRYIVELSITFITFYITYEVVVVKLFAEFVAKD